MIKKSVAKTEPSLYFGMAKVPKSAPLFFPSPSAVSLIPILGNLFTDIRAH